MDRQAVKPDLTQVAVSLFEDEPQVWGDFDALSVGAVSNREAAAFIRHWHYSGGGGTNCICVGLYNSFQLVGVAAFGIPVSGDAAASVFGPEHQARIMDLQRLVLVDEAPGNSESWFIVRALRFLKERRPETWAVTSFADSTQGHLGVIYQATNALYGGKGGTGTAYVDADGVLHSDRLDGRAVSAEVALERGWTKVRRQGKHRYLYLTPDNKSHRRELMRKLCWTASPYPKREAAA